MSRQDDYRLELGRGDAGQLDEVVLVAVDADGSERRTRIGGGRVEAITDNLRRVLSEAGIRGKEWSGTKPIRLERQLGERIELLLTAVKPLRRIDRIQRIADEVASMGAEEASYWHAKTSRPGGLRALRILLSGGGR